jgi:chromosome partitioning protein
METEPAIDAAPAPAHVEPPRPPVIVALLNQKGGVGKTTSTVNLGAALARFGRRVLLVDLDPQSNLSLHFGVEATPEQRSIRDLLLDPACTLDDVVQHARPGLDFVPAVTELALVEGELAQMDGMQGILRDKLGPAAGRYDVVLLDCPPSLGVLSVNALTAADEVFVPMQAHYLPLRGLEKLLQTVHLVAQGLNPSIRVTGILLCMHDRSSGHGRAVIGEIESQFEQFRGSDVPWAAATVLRPPVRRNIKLAEAPSFGQTIFDYAPRCPGAADYRELARGLLERWGHATDAFEGAPRPRAARAARTARAKASRAKPAGPLRAKASGARTSARAARAAAKASKPAARKPKRVAKPVRPTKPKPAPKAAKATRAAPAAKRPKPVKSRKPAGAAKSAGTSMRAKASVRAASRPSGRGRAIRSGGLSL